MGICGRRFKEARHAERVKLRWARTQKLQLRIANSVASGTGEMLISRLGGGFGELALDRDIGRLDVVRNRNSYQSNELPRTGIEPAPPCED